MNKDFWSVAQIDELYRSLSIDAQKLASPPSIPTLPPCPAPKPVPAPVALPRLSSHSTPPVMRPAKGR